MSATLPFNTVLGRAIIRKPGDGKSGEPEEKDDNKPARRGPLR